MLEQVLHNDEGQACWCIGLLEGATLASLTAATVPLPGLLFGTVTPPLTQPHGSNGGPHVVKVGATYNMYMHHADVGALPTTIWHATSADLANWTAPQLLLEYTPNQDIDGAAGQNQVADPTLMHMGGKTYLYYTACANSDNISNLNVARFGEPWPTGPAVGQLCLVGAG
jgi:beta-xylosidase